MSSSSSYDFSSNSSSEVSTSSSETSSYPSSPSSSSTSSSTFTSPFNSPPHSSSSPPPPPPPHPSSSPPPHSSPPSMKDENLVTNYQNKTTTPDLHPASQPTQSKKNSKKKNLHRKEHPECTSYETYTIKELLEKMKHMETLLLEIKKIPLYKDAWNKMKESVEDFILFKTTHEQTGEVTWWIYWNNVNKFLKEKDTSKKSYIYTPVSERMNTIARDEFKYDPMVTMNFMKSRTSNHVSRSIGHRLDVFMTFLVHIIKTGSLKNHVSREKLGFLLLFFWRMKNAKIVSFDISADNSIVEKCYMDPYEGGGKRLGKYLVGNQPHEVPSRGRATNEEQVTLKKMKIEPQNTEPQKTNYINTLDTNNRKMISKSTVVSELEDFLSNYKKNYFYEIDAANLITSLTLFLKNVKAQG